MAKTSPPPSLTAAPSGLQNHSGEEPDPHRTTFLGIDTYSTCEHPVNGKRNTPWCTSLLLGRLMQTSHSCEHPARQHTYTPNYANTPNYTNDPNTPSGALGTPESPTHVTRITTTCSSHTQRPKIRLVHVFASQSINRRRRSFRALLEHFRCCTCCLLETFQDRLAHISCAALDGCLYLEPRILQLRRSSS